jgi:small GTP-binding protein
MGALSALTTRPSRPVRTLVFGLDAAGKTTLLYKLVGDGFKTDTPKIGFWVETAICGGVELVVWDVGGSDTYRPDTGWPMLAGARAVIFFVDASDRDRLEAAAAELHRVLTTGEVHGLPLLVLLNKQDKENAMKAPEAYAGLCLDRATPGRRIHVQPCCALNLDGITDGLDWLAEAVKDPHVELDRGATESRAEPHQPAHRGPASSNRRT